MPILVRSKPPPTAVECVREVRVGIPRELLDELQYFYMLTLGLVPWPAELQVPGGWGLGNPQAGLHLQFRHDPVVDPLRRRFTLTVASLATLGERLERRQWPYQRVRSLSVCDQSIRLHDPAGHLIEIRQTQPL